MKPLKMQNYLLTANSPKHFNILISRTACFQQLLVQNISLQTWKQAFQTFMAIFSNSCKHICLKLTHEHDYLMCTMKSKGLSGHMLTTELYTCPQLHYGSAYAPNYKSLGNFGFFFLVLFFPSVFVHH